MAHEDLGQFLNCSDFLLPTCPLRLGGLRAFLVVLLKSRGKSQPTSVHPENRPVGVVAGPRQKGPAGPVARGSWTHAWVPRWGAELAREALPPKCPLQVATCTHSKRTHVSLLGWPDSANEDTGHGVPSEFQVDKKPFCSGTMSQILHKTL